MRGSVHATGDRLLLRDFVASDEAAVHAFAGDPVVTRLTDWGPNEPADTREFIAGAVARARDADRLGFDLAAVHGLGCLRLRRIAATCHPDNRASARVLEKIGMRREGRLRSHLFVRGAWRDSLLYAAVNDDVRYAAANGRGSGSAGSH
jgi:RimJ/RimL family protein N-acetyltransferase